MNTLQRITTLFDPIEDRIQITGETDANAKIRLWLTHRLFTSLIPHLINWLQQQQASTPNLNAQMSFQQAKALQELNPSEPRVITSEDDKSILVDSIDLNINDKLMRLSFKANTDVYAINFSQMGLQQWLTIVFNTYQNANWHFDQWPVWLKKPASNLVQSLTTLH